MGETERCGHSFGRECIYHGDSYDGYELAGTTIGGTCWLPKGHSGPHMERDCEDGCDYVMIWFERDLPTPSNPAKTPAAITSTTLCKEDPPRR